MKPEKYQETLLRQELGVYKINRKKSTGKK
jgi:hypothetical protein